MRKIIRCVSSLLFVGVSVSGAHSALARDDAKKTPPARASLCSDIAAELKAQGNEDAPREIAELIERTDQSNIQAILQKRYNLNAQRAQVYASCINSAHFRRNKDKSQDKAAKTLNIPCSPGESCSEQNGTSAN